jgi:endo-1,4-beta-xylanase
VGLTYDDGPDPAQTPRLLDALRARDARATFFLIGQNAGGNAPIVARQVAEGHVVGNHTQTHPRLPELTLEGVRAELEAADARIVAAGAPEPILFRPPYGETNDDIAIVASQQGMWQVLWHVDTNDWRDGRTLDEIVAATLDGAGPGRVVLFHDRVANSVAAVPIIVDGLRQRGLCPGVVRPSGASWTVVPG